MAASQPFPLITTPTSQLRNGEKPDQFCRCASEMANVHNMILRGLNSIYLQAPHIKSADEQSFLGYSSCLYDLIHVHHEGEEDILFPAIVDMSGETGVMDQNIEQHHVFHQGLEDYNAYVRSCLNGTEKYNGSRLVAIIDGFGQQLASHLAQEISTLLDLRKYGDKMDKFEKKFEEWSNKDTLTKDVEQSNLSVPGALSWGFFNHDKQYEGGLWENWPPAPAPVVFIVRWVTYWKHSDWWRFAPCDRYGKPKERLFAEA
ncbi:hemerythrin hhe cation binding domain-containing [Trichoderma arundinaceum]|uniref:Hemerythrin hhe cation binding domain-containing n=1 Tax=Trichoderma arundinaceum TaxID=490622 RepID=A0A395NVH7_TRIAR|nr:hemerythrin hhe cation binding domain-containing [Trichoderma arundinaceum]